MFAGEEETVKLEVHNGLVGVILDRFGTDTMIIPADEEHFRVNVRVSVSNQFFGWVFGLGDGIKILGPENVKMKMKEEIEKIQKFYF